MTEVNLISHNTLIYFYFSFLTIITIGYGNRSQNPPIRGNIHN
ncbi:ion channel [Nitratireductor sp. ZSWI3]